MRLRTPLEAGAKAPGMVQRVPGEACPYGLAVAYRTGKAIKWEGAGSIPAVPAPSRIFLQSAKSRANVRDSFFMEARASLAHAMAHARGSGLTGLIGQQGFQQRLAPLGNQVEHAIKAAGIPRVLHFPGMLRVGQQ